jgi:hypothetical protein
MRVLLLERIDKFLGRPPWDSVSGECKYILGVFMYSSRDIARSQ